MTTATEILTDALIDINALAPGQILQPNNAAVALRKLNDLMDSLSVDEDFIPYSVENISSPGSGWNGWIAGQAKYTIGNPVGGTFNGTLVISTNVISGVTVPPNLKIGGDVSDNQGSLPNGTTVTAFNAGAGTVTVSNPAVFSVPVPEQFTFTVPGDIKLPRPLRFQKSYTRITSSGNTGLDYWFDFVPMDRYNEIGYKGVPGPWPIVAAYQPTFPLGTLWVYPAPSQAGEVHLFTDLILNNAGTIAFPLITTNYNLPQGYARALKKLTALELAPSYGKSPSRQLERQAAEARAFLKSLNASPVALLHYDTEIVRSQSNNAGWIMDGGFT